MKQRKESTSPTGSARVNGRTIDTFTRGFVRKAARQLAGKHGFRETDRGEIEQRLYLKLAARMDQADPDDPKWKAFVAKTVRRHVASMIRDNRAEKRDHRRTCSIHVIVGIEDDGPVTLAETLSECECKSRRGWAFRSSEELADLAMDLAACIDELPDPRHREFCERLKHASISQVARDMGIPRTTLNTWLRKLRKRFQDRGLEEYFQESSSVRCPTGFLIQ